MPPRPLPVINEMNQHFWRGGADGRLHIQRCETCRTWHHPYVAACSKCLSRDLKPEPVSGRGTILAVTINHQPWFPSVPVPYAIALVELEEQRDIRLMSNIRGLEAEEVKPGLAVKVCFEQHDDIYVPLFEPA